MNVEGVSVVITGAASGLGAATARYLAERGAKVGLIDLRIDAGEALAAELGGAFARADVADETGAGSALAALALKNGPVRVLVNCAGIGGAARIVSRDGPMPLDDFEKIIRVNLVGTFNMLRLAAAQMVTGKPDQNGERGVIISTASVAAFEGQIGQSAYSASKGGIAALTLPAAREFAQFGVRVLSIAPGLFMTPLLGEMPEEVQQSLAETIPFPKRLGRPEEFAQLVEAMIANSYFNGETVRLDGALRMQPR